jgi:hypothetical protein
MASGFFHPHIPEFTMLRKIIAAAALLCAACTSAYSQPVKVVATCGTVSPAFSTALTSAVITMDVNGNLCTAASVSASISGFPTVQSTGTPIAVTTGGVTGTLPTGAVVVASNVGSTNGAFCKLGASATVSDQLIPPNSWFAFTVGGNTQLTCITSASTTTVNMVGGSGLPTGSGGGGGAGGGGAATIADGADVAEGAKADAVCATPATTTPCSMVALAKAINNNAAAGVGTSGSAAPSNIIMMGALNGANAQAIIGDPCQTAVKVYTPINVVTATNTIITGVAAKKKYVCGIFLYPAGTQNVAIFQATTATACATALVGVIGGTTTATGIIMTAQAGFVLGNGASAVAATTVNQTDLCIVTSAAVQVSGVVVTVDQ